VASLTQTRDTLVKQRSALKNKVNNILSARGLNLAKEALSSEKKLAEVLDLPFDEIVRIAHHRCSPCPKRGEHDLLGYNPQNAPPSAGSQSE
jgi:hypothetical protein